MIVLATNEAIRIEEDHVRTFAAFAVVLLALGAATESRAQEQQSFKSLMGKGYEIKAVTFARGESTENKEAFIITLQKDKSVAVCYMLAPNWISLSNPILDDARRCDVR